MSTSTVRVSPALAPSRPSSKPGIRLPAAQLDELVAALAARQLARGVLRPGGIRQQRADVVDDDEVALARPRARPSEGAPGARAWRRSPAESAPPRRPARGGRPRGPRRRRARPWAEPRSRSRTRAPRPAGGRSPSATCGSPTGHDARGLDRVGVPAGERVAHGFLQHGLTADSLDDERSGHLAAAEAGELQLAPELIRLVLEPALQLARRHLHLQAHARVGKLGYGGLHGDRHPRHDTVPPRERQIAPPAARAGRDLAVDGTGGPPRRRHAGLRRGALPPPARASASRRTLRRPPPAHSERPGAWRAAAPARRPLRRSSLRTTASPHAAPRAPSRWRSRSGGRRRS